MDRFAALTTFVAVAERGGFKAASRHLGHSPPAVTRTIAALERHLGVPLFRRSTRSVALTEEGAALLDRAREILMRLQDAEHVVMGRQAAPHGELDGMIAQLDEMLEAANFYFPPARTAATRRTLRTLLTKPGWSTQEVRTLRGVLSALDGAKARRNQP